MADKRQYKIMERDPYLANYAGDIELRMNLYKDTKKKLVGKNGKLTDFANGHKYYGFHPSQQGWVYREWAPGADAMAVIGDFNHWDPEASPMKRINENGDWEVEVKELPHQSRVKVRVTRNGDSFDRIPLYIHRVVQDPETFGFYGQIWHPDKLFVWTDEEYKVPGKPLLIYEAHIGMADEKGHIASYDHFTEEVLPRIKADGYNTIQLMAVMQHPYYSSFGYQVSNFFAASSWYGEPEGLKRLVNTAHEMGITVLLDLVHSHAVRNTSEGINEFDGTDYQFFHAGPEGDHPAWGTKLFDYGKPAVLHFLLSNLKYWMEEYHFDGFRFDGVTSMLYRDHGLGTVFDSYKKYFSMNTDTQAITYLQLANELVHAVNPFAVTIAEDMSGMPGMALPIRTGGVGFDYRLSMGVPDFWIRLLKDYRDEDWDMYKLWYELTTRRPGEKNIGYCESHDQALVGDKTLIFRMADAEMYTGMDKAYHSPVIDRAVDLHKLIRFSTLVLASEGYLNFMGNEFGHPEWIDFPREGNGWSYKYARRQWSLAENGYLKYEWLENFDRAMLKFARKYRVLSKPQAVSLWIDQERKIISFAKGDMLYLFNFNTTQSVTNYFMHAHITGEGGYRAIFSSDAADFGGQERVNMNYIYETKPGKRGVGFEVYAPCRTAIVFQKVE